MDTNEHEQAVPKLTAEGAEERGGKEKWSVVTAREQLGK